MARFNNRYEQLARRYRLALARKMAQWDHDFMTVYDIEMITLKWEWWVRERYTRLIKLPPTADTHVLPELSDFCEFLRVSRGCSLAETEAYFHDWEKYSQENLVAPF